MGRKKGSVRRGQLNDKTGKYSHFMVLSVLTEGFFNAGEVKWNPPRPEINKDQGKQVCFSRTSSGGSFVATDVPKAPIPDLFPPCKITDLKAKIEGDNLLNLTWTAPGDDYDHGRGKLNVVWTL